MNSTTRTLPSNRTDIQKYLDQRSPRINVSKDRILSLKKWAADRFEDSKRSSDWQSALLEMNHWDGYIRAINEILEMEAQS